VVSGLDRLSLPTAALLACAVAAAVAGVPYLPTHDGPQHVYTIHAAARLDDPATGWGRWFEANTPVTNHGFAAVFAPLDAWLPWQTALRAALALIAVAWVGGAYALSRALHPARGWPGIALGAGALQWSLYMGFFSFLVATATGLWVLAFACARTSREAPRAGWLAALLFLQALLHVMAAALFGCVLAALVWLRGGRDAPARTLARIAAIGAPAAGVMVAAMLVQRFAGDTSGSDPTAASAWIWPPLWTLGKCFLGGPAWRAWPLTALALAAPVLALAERGGSARAEDRALRIAGLVLLGAGAAAPLHLPSWEFFSVRFVPLGVCAAVVSLPLERIEAARARAAIAAGLAGFALAATGWAFAYHRALAADAAAALAGLSADIRRDGPRLAIVLDPAQERRRWLSAADPMPWHVPLANLGKLYATEQGGYVPDAFAIDPSVHAVLVRDDAREHLPAAADPRHALELADPSRAGDPAFREAVASHLAAFGTRYRDVILYGRPADVDHLVWLGYTPEWRSGGLAIARFEGCPLALRFPETPDRDAADVLELGWYPALDTAHSYRLSRAKSLPDGARVLPLRESCGPVWIGFEDRALRCAGARADGRLVVRSVREEPELECRVERADPHRAGVHASRGGAGPSGAGISRAAGSAEE
jgi:hypothetical protein